MANITTTATSNKPDAFNLEALEKAIKFIEVDTKKNIRDTFVSCALNYLFYSCKSLPDEEIDREAIRKGLYETFDSLDYLTPYCKLQEGISDLSAKDFMQRKADETALVRHYIMEGTLRLLHRGYIQFRPKGNSPHE